MAFAWTAKINGIDLRSEFGVQINKEIPDGLLLPPTRDYSFQIPGHHGPIDFGSFYDARTIIIEGQIWGSSRDNLWTKIDSLRNWVALPSNVQLFPDLGSDGIQAMKLEIARMSGRYYLVNYDGSSRLNKFVDDWDRSSEADFSIGLRAVYPFAVSDVVETSIGSITATDKFTYIENLGTYWSPTTIHIIGSAVNPKYVIGKTGYLCKFNLNHTATNLLKNEVNPDSFSSAFRYADGKLGQSIGIFDNITGTQGDTFSFDTMLDGSTPTGAVANRLNANQGTIWFWFRPEWDGDDDTEHFMFDARTGANERIYIHKTAGNKLRGYCIFGGTTCWGSINVDSTNMPAGSWVGIALRWDVNNTIDDSSYYVQLDLVNSSPEEHGDTDALGTIANLPATAYLGEDTSSGGEARANGYFDDFAIWGRVLDDADITALYNSGSGARADTISNGLIAYLDFDGTAGGVVPSGAGSALGSQAEITLKTNPDVDTTATVVTIGETGSDTEADAAAQAIFGSADTSSRVVVYDETGYKAETVMNDSSVDRSLTVISNGNVPKVGVSLDLDAGHTAISSGSGVHDITTEDLGFAAWVRLNTDAVSENYIFYKIASSTGYFLRILNGVISVGIDDGPDSYGMTGNTDIRDDKWHHVAAIVDRDNAANCKIYLDGYEDGTTNKVGTLASVGSLTNSGTLIIGAPIGFDGKLRDAILAYPADITAANEMGASGEVLTLATNPLNSGSYCNYEDYWACTENTGTTITGTANNLTLSNTAAWNQLAYISKNLIADPGMENGGIGGWGAGANTSLEKDTTAVKKDTHSLKLTNTAGGSNGFTDLDVVVGSGDNYVIRGYARASNPDGARTLIAADGGTLMTATQAGLAADTWKFVETCYETVDSNIDMQLHVTSTTNGHAIYLDTIRILPNLVDNGGMEGTYSSGVAPGWTGQGGATYSEENTIVHSGSASQEVLNSTGSADRLIQGVSFTSGEWYEITAWVYVSSGTVRFRSTEHAVFQIDSSGTGSWQRLSVVVKAASTGSSFLQLHSASGTSTFYADDISIVHRPDLDATVTAMGSNYLYQPTRSSYGSYVRNGGVIEYLSLGDFNPDQFGFVVRCYPQFPSDLASGTSDIRVLFEAYGDTDAIYRLSLVPGSTPGTNMTLRFTVVDPSTTTNYDATVNDWTYGEYVEFSGFTKSDVGTTLYQDGTALTVSGGTTTWTTMTDIPTDVRIGCQLSGSTYLYQPNVIFDEVLLTVKQFTANELVSIATKNDTFENDNIVMEISETLDDGDYIKIDATRWTVRKWDASASSESNIKASASSGGFPFLPATDAILYMTADGSGTIIDDAKLYHRNHYL